MLHRYNQADIIEYKVTKKREYNIFSLYFETSIEAEMFFMKFTRCMKSSKEMIDIVSALDNEVNIKTTKEISNIFDTLKLIKKHATNDDLSKYLSNFEIQSI